MQVKGWVTSSTTIYPAKPKHINTKYVECIPPDAIRCEAFITIDDMYPVTGELWIDGLPPHLIGKKVSVIIMEIKEEK